MKERIEINSNELEGVVGGAITWRPNGECFDRDHPDTVYHFDVSRFDEIQIYEERQPNGQWLKSIHFKLPIIDEDMSLSLDNDSHIETVCLLTHS